MSIESLHRALIVPGVSAAERLVLIGIANHDGEGGAWPSVDTLARYACVTRRSVQRTLTALVGRGLVTVDYRAGGTATTPADKRPNRYTLHLDSDGVTPVSPGPPRGDTGDPRGVTPVSPEPSLNLAGSDNRDAYTRSELLSFAAGMSTATWSASAATLAGRLDDIMATTPLPPMRIAALAARGDRRLLDIWRSDQ